MFETNNGFNRYWITWLKLKDLNLINILKYYITAYNVIPR